MNRTKDLKKLNGFLFVSRCLSLCVRFLLISCSFILVHLMVVSVPLSSCYLLKIFRIQWLINFLDFKIATVWQTMSYYYQHYNINGHFEFWLRRFVVWSCKKKNTNEQKKHNIHWTMENILFNAFIVCATNITQILSLCFVGIFFLSLEFANAIAIWFDLIEKLFRFS